VGTQRYNLFQIFADQFLALNCVSWCTCVTKRLFFLNAPALAVTLGLLALPLFGQTDSLALASGIAGADQTASLNLSVTSPAGSEPAALQWTFTYTPSAITSLTASIGSAASAAGKTLSCASGSGTYTCVLYSMNTTTIANGVVAVVNVTIATGVGSASIGVTNQVAASATGNNINLTATGGSVTGSVSAPALSISKTHTGSFSQGQSNAQYTVTVSNRTGAGATSGTVTMTDTLPSGLSLVAMSGSGWSCTANSCTRSNALAGGSSYPAITVTVNVAANAPATVTNQASVSGGGSASASAMDPTTISAPDVIASPASGTTLTDAPVTFCWSNNGNYLHWLDVGTASGVGDLYGGTVAPGTTCKSITNIPGNGGTVYVRVFSYINSVWQPVPGSSATYTAPLHAFSPPDGTVFAASTVTFSWSPVPGAASYWLDVGPYKGNGSIFGAVLNGTTQNVPNIIPTGVPIWARLWAKINGTWLVQGDHQYTACNGCVSTITTPAPTTRLASSTLQFCWTSTVGADQYWLDVGTAPAQGNIYGANQGTGTCQTVSGIPLSGTVYVQLFTHMGADWKPAMQYEYLASNSAAQILSPPPNSKLESSTVTFTWNSVTGATGYWLDVGTSQGQGNIYGGYQNLATSVTVNNIPSGTIWVRLWTYSNGLVVPVDFTYAN
jgi:uncharacterized repeat protein (TIGR01451 family)